MAQTAAQKKRETVPTYEEIMLPLLRFAVDGQPHRVREAVNPVSDHFGLTETAVNEKLTDGRNRLIHRLEWARTYLRKAGLLDYPARGQFQITPLGMATLKEDLREINARYLERFPGFTEFRHGRPNAKVGVSAELQAADPEESIDNSYQVLREEIEGDLLERLKNCSPDFFERVVVDLLLQMGYGGSRKEAGRAIGKSGDEGIDGVIDEDALGLDVVYIQAKRWTDKAVRRHDIQQFVGALQGKRARKGIFITTSTFAENARDYVKQIENKVVLIDGRMLSSLMFEHGVGVTAAKTYTLKRVDSDYFEE